MPSSGTAIGSIAAGAPASHSTSSQPPAESRSDLSRVRPSRRTPPARAMSAADVREKPSSFARAASTRSPSRPSGTGRLLLSAMGLGGVLRVGVVPRGPGAVESDATEGQDEEQPHARHDRDVGQVEDRREAPDRDEVDDVAHPEARRPEEPVGEVAERAAEEHPEENRPAPRADSAGGA